MPDLPAPSFENNRCNQCFLYKYYGARKGYYMRRRILAAFLSMVMLLSCLISMSGCAAQVENKLTLGQWLGMINQSFGMDTYMSEEPYFQDVGTDDSLFGTVQAAAEWGVVGEAEELHPEQTLTWRSALVTLVNACGFLPEETTESDKIGYALEHFAPDARSYWMDREISQASAEEALETAVNQWQNFTYDTPVEKVAYSEDTVDLSQGEEKVTDYQIEDDTVILPEEVAQEIQPGDIYVLPAGEDSMETQAFRAESVTQENGKTYITNDPQEPELTDFVEDLDLQQTIVPNLENMEIFDGNGNLVSSGSAVQQEYTEEPQIENMSFDSADDPKLQDMAKLDTTFTTPEGFKVSFGVSNHDNNFSMTASITYPLGTQSGDASNKSELKVGAELSNLSVTQEAKVKWFKLKSAKLQINYETKHSLGAEFGTTPVNKVLAPYDNRNSSFLSNLKNSAFKDQDAKGAKTIASRKTIKICSMNIYNAGVAKVCLDVAFKISLNGSFTISVTERGAKGIEYKDGNVRKISDSKKDVDFSASGKVEGTLSVGPALYVVGLKKKVVGLALEVGVGASASGKLHLADEQNHLLEEASAGDDTLEAYGSIAGYDLKAAPSVIQEIAESQGGTYHTNASEVKLHADLCIDVQVYFILKIGLDDNAYVDGGGKASFEIFGKDNATLGSIHIDCPKCNFLEAELHMGGGDSAADQCIFQYDPFGQEEESSSSENESANSSDSSNGTSESSDGSQSSGSSSLQEETLILEHLELTLEKGDSGKVAIKSLPNGVEMSDLVFTSEDPAIVQVDQNGNVKALESGATVVSVETKDGAHHVQCSIIVLSESEEFEGLAMGLYDSQREIRC